MLTIIAIAIGVGIGLLRGGKIPNLRGARLAWWPLLVAGIVLQSAAELWDIPRALLISLAGMGLLLIGLGLNPHIKGTIVTGIGVLSNLFVTVLNGSVPIRLAALQEIGKVPLDVVDPTTVAVSGLREIETSETTLASLGDVIPLFGNVVSIGDLITHAGIIVILQNLIAARRKVGISVDDLLGPVQAAPVLRMEGSDTSAQPTKDPAPPTVDLRDPPAPAPTTAPAPQIFEPAGLSTFATTSTFKAPVDLRGIDGDQPEEETDETLDLTTPFEAAQPSGQPFDYGDPDDFADGVGVVRPIRR